MVDRTNDMLAKRFISWGLPFRFLLLKLNI